MSPRRFVVQTVSGFRTPNVSSSGKPGLSAHVCDRLHLYAVVGSFRSESRMPTFQPQNLGAAGAIEAATALAERLNRDTA